jgi:branched-chain amino acid aminotransferase
MIPILDRRTYLERLLSAERAGADAILAYYEHRLGAIVRDGRLMLAPLDDHMFHRGDGVFEAAKFTHGRLYQLDGHLTRLRRSAEGIRLAPPCPWEEVRSLALETARAAGSEAGQLRVFLGRGPGGFGLDPAEAPRPSLYIVATRFSPRPPSWYERGLTGFRTSVPARAPHLSQIKDTNYLNAVFMTLEARDRGKDIPLCFDAGGALTESATANICLVDKEGVLVVPEFTQALPGTTILRALELLRGKIPREIRRVPEEEIFEAAELLLLGTSPGCAPVTEYEGRPIGGGRRGPVARLIYDLLEEDLLRNGIKL